jgi:glucose-1-phosphate adenylyltransferase
MGVYVFNAGLPVRAADPRQPTIRPPRTTSARTSSRTSSSASRVFAHDFADSCVGGDEGLPYWRDVGTVDAYWEANMDVIHVTPELNLYDETWPIWTYQEQLPPAKFIFDDDDRRGMAVDSMVSGGCIISGALVRRSLLFSTRSAKSSWSSSGTCTSRTTATTPRANSAGRGPTCTR